MCKIKVLFINLLLLIELTAFAQTNVGGVYFSNTNWSVSGSPYNVTGDVQIPSGVTLSIEPGVKINFSGDYQILVKGMIVANGTTTSPICFSGSLAGRAMLMFKSTNLSNSQLSFLKFTGPKYALQLEDESEFSQSQVKITGVLNVNKVELLNSAILTKGYGTSASLVLNDATISSSLIKGVYPRSEPILLNNATISNSTINSDSYNAGITLKSCTANNTHFPIGCCGGNINVVSSTISSSFFEEGGGQPVTGPLRISGSTLTNTTVNLPAARVEISGTTASINSLNGIAFGNGFIKSSTISGSNGWGKSIVITGYDGYNIGGNVLIRNCTINQNSIGISIGGANSVIIDSCHFDNSLYNVQNVSPRTIVAKNNWWGTTDPAEIGAKILDYYDDINYGIVDYSNNITTNSYSISMQVGSGGTVKQNDVTLANNSTVSVEAGTTKTFVIAPNAGYVISTLSLNGVDVKSQVINGQYSTPVINSNGTLSVTFIKVQYRLSVKTGDSGTFSLFCDYGATPSFDITAPVGMKISSVLFNGISVINSVVDGVYTVPPISANSSLIVAYANISTGVNGLSSDEIKVYGTPYGINIDGTIKGETINVFTMLGKQIRGIQSEGEHIIIPIDRGAVYFVKTSTKTFKVVL